jgi:DNA-binding transcriptional ArsR family regulator
MEVENKKVAKQSKKPKKPVIRDAESLATKEEFAGLSGRLDSILERFDSIAAELEMTNHICRILIELVGGVDPGRKNLTNLELVKLRNEGVKVKDLARMQGISQCAMGRKLKELREAGVLHDREAENN